MTNRYGWIIQRQIEVLSTNSKLKGIYTSTVAMTESNNNIHAVKLDINAKQRESQNVSYTLLYNLIRMCQKLTTSIELVSCKRLKNNGAITCIMGKILHSLEKYCTRLRLVQYFLACTIFSCIILNASQYYLSVHFHL